MLSLNLSGGLRISRSLSKPRSFRFALPLLAAAASFTAFSSSRATTYTWISTTSSTWNSSASWSPSGVPGAADSVVTQSAGTNGSLLLRSDFTVASVTDSSANTWTWNPNQAGTYNVSVGALTVSGGSQLTIRNNSAQLVNYSGTSVRVTNTSVLSFGLGPSSYINNVLISDSTAIDAGSTLQIALINGGTASFGALTVNGTLGLYQIAGTENNLYKVNSLAGSGLIATGTKSGISTTGAATLTISPGAGTSSNFSGTIANYSTIPLSVTLAGSGTQIFSGVNTYTGSTTITAGTLVVNGSIGNSAVTVGTQGTLSGSGTIGGPVTINGTLAPGSTLGTLTVNNSLILGSAANTLLDIEGTSAGSFDRVALTGVASNLTLDGVITGSLVNGYVATVGDSFDLLDWTGVLDASGFNLATDLILPSLGGSATWDTSNFLSSGVITVAAVPEPQTWLLASVGFGVALAGVRRLKKA